MGTHSERVPKVDYVRHFLNTNIDIPGEYWVWCRWGSTYYFTVLYVFFTSNIYTSVDKVWGIASTASVGKVWGMASVRKVWGIASIGKVWSMASVGKVRKICERRQGLEDLGGVSVPQLKMPCTDAMHSPACPSSQTSIRLHLTWGHRNTWYCCCCFKDCFVPQKMHV